MASITFNQPVAFGKDAIHAASQGRSQPLREFPARVTVSLDAAMSIETAGGGHTPSDRTEESESEDEVLEMTQP